MENADTNSVPAPWATGGVAAPETPVAAPETPVAAPEAAPVVTAPVVEVKTKGKKIVDEVKADIVKVEAEVKTVAGEFVEMVTVTVPKEFKLQLDHFRQVIYKAGIQEMERLHAEHWWAKANGVTIYDPKAAPAPTEPPTEPPAAQ
jgi:hypothetical protein